MAAFEYRIETLAQPDPRAGDYSAQVAALNALGLDGWELVAINVAGHEQRSYVFKRALWDSAEARAARETKTPHFRR